MHTYIDVYVPTVIHKYINMFVHIHRASLHTDRNTHAHALEEQRYPTPPLASILCTKSEAHILFKGHHTFTFALYTSHSPTSPFRKLFLISIQYDKEAVPTPYIYNSSILKGKTKRKYQDQSSSSKYLWVLSIVPRLQNGYWSKGRNNKKIISRP